MICRTSLLLTLAAVATAQADGHVLEIDVDTASVTVAPSAVRRNSLRLPALEYVFSLRTRCAAPFRAVSLSLTVADSRRALGGEALESAGDATELRLTVPANQLAPVPVTGFCQPADADDGTPRNDELLLRATLSAGASLTCETDAERQITYASAPLDIRVNCVLPEAAPDAE